ncbi:MAG: transglycosylase domain-containing protein [Candidatus Shapirobacteria bacterium]|nr:transglycosylase domain-containing protein [Candidatus Shapirobacteria bacterium]MDD5073859.1 transglycosylase domain-containing protein [Candidatus Shapirobacteria bacterium]MDD5481736.1 transglycosylase domain-containing protein [Candidatus Shapirobacteria bacterium]
MVKKKSLISKKMFPFRLFRKKRKSQSKNQKKLTKKPKTISRKSLSVGLVMVLVLLGAVFYLIILKDLPSPKKLSQETSFSTSIHDRNGKLLYEIYVDKNRLPVRLDQLPDHIKEATLAIEDQDFYHHYGFSLRGIARAFYKTVFGRSLQGGSTITQQLVKNALLTPERTLTRKVREALLTVATEIIYTKDEILEMYFNQTPYGGTAWGIEAAARRYFDKSASELNLAEASLLAGLPASPTTYSPFGAWPQLAKDRQALVLGRMVEAGFISEKEADQAKEEELKYATIKEPISAPHFVMYVKEQLVNIFGQKQVEQGGLKVITSLDWEIQEEAQNIVKEEIDKSLQYNVTNGAVLVTNPKTGEILAMVGSRDYFDNELGGNFNVTTNALRQPGSSIKPINYAIALDKGKITAATPLIDAPTCFTQAGLKSYCPSNYNNSFNGIVQARFALGNSYNIPAVKVLALNGLDVFIEEAKDFGITTFTNPKNYGLSLTLGGGEVKMTDMATAFGVLANLGVKKNLVTILEVTDKDGQIILDNRKTLGQIGQRVIGKEAAYITSHILLDNGARSAVFGPYSYLVVKEHPEVSVKTGTTNNLRDNWTIGYNPSRLVAVWIGNNDNTPMRSVSSGAVGASSIWNKVITFVFNKDELPEEWPSKPENVIGASVCSLSGNLPGESGCQTRFEYFIKGYLPPVEGNRQETVLINRDTGTLVKPGEEVENVEHQEKTILRDPLGAIFCLDCPNSEKPDSIRYPL